MARFGVGSQSVESLADSEERRGSGSELRPRDGSRAEPWLHQEVSHLPEKYRVPIVLCYFEGLTHRRGRAAAGLPAGHGQGTAVRARDLLAPAVDPPRVTLSAAAHRLGSRSPKPGRPFPLHSRWRRQGLPSRWPVMPVNRSRAASSVSIPVTTLAEGVLHTMIWNQVRLTAASLLLAGTLATGFVVGATQLSGGPAMAASPGRPQQSSPSFGRSIQAEVRIQRAAAQVGGGLAPSYRQDHCR